MRVFFSEDLKRYPLDTVNAILAIAGLCPLNHIGIDVSVTKPVAQERCKFALCGALPASTSRHKRASTVSSCTTSMRLKI